MFTKIKNWFKNEVLNDPYEASAAYAFGIGYSLGLVVFAITLCLIKVLT